MDEEFYRNMLNSVIERVSWLENEVRNLRQLLFVQQFLAKPIDTPLPIPTNPVLSRSNLDECNYWEVTCLGNFHLRYADHELVLCRSRRGQSIFKYLLSRQGYAASSETLIECFWPQVDPAAGAHSLQVTIHALRSSLRGFGPNRGDEAILFDNKIYFLNPALNIVQDVDRFRDAFERGQHGASNRKSAEAKQAFQEARALYTGDYHANCYDEWAASRRLDLIDMRLSLLSQLGALYDQDKEWGFAIDCYREILTVDCYREDIYRQLMRCYAACGRQADVKRTYHSCQEHLRNDLRLAPAPETTTLYQKLIQQKTSLDAN